MGLKTDLNSRLPKDVAARFTVNNSCPGLCFDDIIHGHVDLTIMTIKQADKLVAEKCKWIAKVTTTKPEVK